LGAAERSALLGVIESAIEIRTARDLRQWSGARLQQLLPHALLACGVGEISDQGPAFRPLLFEGVSPPPLDDIIAPDLSAVRRLVSRCWRERTPQLTSIDDEDPVATLESAAGALGNIAAHSEFDAGEVALSFVAFGRMPEKPGDRHAYVLNLLMSYLHLILQRVQASAKPVVTHKEASQVRLTGKEMEILH
jgi:hypothetical protein